MRRQLTLQVLAHHRDGRRSTSACRRYRRAARREQLDVVTGLIDDLKAGAPPTLPALLVLMREIGRLARPAERGSAW